MEKVVYFQLLLFLKLTICSLLLSLVFIFFTVLKPHFRKSMKIFYFPVTRVIYPSSFAWIFRLLSTLLTTSYLFSNSKQLETSFGMSGSCLKWIFFYLSNRSSVVSLNNSYFSPFSFPFGVFQKSVLGPLLFILYTSGLSRIISSFSLQSHLYADDSYIFTSFPKYELSSTISKISPCFGKIIFWSDSMFLKLNPSKFDLIYFTMHSHLIESLLSINISSNLSLASSPTIHSSGFTFDSSLSLIPKIKSVAKSSYFHFRRITSP